MNATSDDFLLVVGVGIAVFCIYFFPWAVASFRKSASEGTVFIVNLFFGWTIIGWLIAVVMAVSTETTDAVKLRKLMLKKIAKE